MTEDTTKMEKRAVEGFTRLGNKGIGNVILTQGDHDELVIEADPELRERIRTEVKDGTLRITYDFDWQDVLGLRFIGRGPIRFHVTMKTIEGLSMSGAGNVEAKAITADKLDVALSGAGNIHIENLTAKALVSSLSGAGNITVGGTLDSLDMHFKWCRQFSW